ncbi:MAG: ATP-binding protein, partial [Desulfobacteraceae bacterium]|nr:ATP-binding protein [Desulfobacteraceae bacterium]
MTDSNEWKTKVHVGEAIVDLLSQRIYRTLSIALKELVSNAWDADADCVQIFIHEDKKQIAIIDDGRGMTKKELKNYVNIAISGKPKEKNTLGGRPTIGHYGIGVLSALPFCKKII